MKVTQKRYIQVFCIVVVVLGMVRCIFPSVAGKMVSPVARTTGPIPLADSLQAPASQAEVPSVAQAKALSVADTIQGSVVVPRSRFFCADGSLVKNRILSVPNFGNTFPDQNDVQLVSANKWGVVPVNDVHEAEHRKNDLVYVGANPYFYVDRLRSSIPYLVPRASVLLQDIGRSFFDSLQTKGVPLHKIIVTSVMRSKKDVERLRSHNRNATQNSCHMYGTTFDIAYNRYKTVQAPGESRRVVRNDTLKWVLSEVLRDMREHSRCWIKYEVHQGCFHITVR
ncbi:MAG: DUF5715 family protein [Prevotella sp.]|nr:DUF5715 family protein [Prevotella sp.]MDD7606752.1 DUF5715 family protein [Prevotellaceae bacterium]MDY3247637.1 DUF5715 family protein [Prevotella sp.]